MQWSICMHCVSSVFKTSPLIMESSIPQILPEQQWNVQRHLYTHRAKSSRAAPIRAKNPTEAFHHCNLRSESKQCPECCNLTILQCLHPWMVHWGLVLLLEAIQMKAAGSECATWNTAAKSMLCTWCPRTLHTLDLKPCGDCP